MKRAFAAVLFVFFAMSICGIAADVAEDARKVVDTHKDAVVTLMIVMETTTTYDGQSEKHQSKMSATATVIDPSGLVVSSLSSVNLSEAFKDSMGEEDENYSTSSKVVDAKIKLGDGTELQADIVLRDPDLDLLFVKTKKAPEKPLAYVDISQASTPQLFDEIILLSRLGTVGNREIAADIDRVRAIITKPRKFYVVGGLWSFEMGIPAFTLDGKAVGILTLRTSKNRDSFSDFGMVTNQMLPTIIPCSTLATVAEQAKNAKPEEVVIESEKPGKAPEGGDD